MFRTQYHETEPVRVDKFLAEQVTEVSRQQIKELIKAGLVTKDGEPIKKPKEMISLGQVIEVDVAEWKRRQYAGGTPEIDQAMKDQVKVVFEHADFLVIEKPAGLLVHRTNNPNSYSLVEILKERFPDITGVSEPMENRNDGNLQDRDGIVHRIDKDTSGLLIIARNFDAYYYFKSLFQNRQIIKKYICLVRGIVKEDLGEIRFPITRSKLDHTRRVAVMNKDDQEFYGKKRSALTEYIVLDRLNDVTLLDVFLHTGRTHQIRVHMKAIGHPIVGDRIYGTKEDQAESLQRQFLHASELKFQYEGQEYHFKSELPNDLAQTLESYSH